MKRNICSGSNEGHPSRHGSSHPLFTLDVLCAHAWPSGIVSETTATLATVLDLEPWECRTHLEALKAARHIVRMPTGDLRVFRQSLFHGSTGAGE